MLFRVQDLGLFCKGCVRLLSGSLFPGFRRIVRDLVACLRGFRVLEALGVQGLLESRFWLELKVWRYWEFRAFKA